MKYMGFFSDAKAAADVQRIKRGGTANLSISQIVCLITNMMDAKNNLSDKEYKEVHDLFIKMRGCTTKVKMNIDTYTYTAVEIIKYFDKLAPYEKYCGGNDFEYSLLMQDIFGENHKKIRSLRREIYRMELVLEETDELTEKNAKILKDAYSDKQLEELVASGKFPADRVAEYKNSRDILATSIETGPSMRESLVAYIDDLKKQLEELEPKK